MGSRNENRRQLPFKVGQKIQSTLPPPTDGSSDMAVGRPSVYCTSAIGIGAAAPKCLSKISAQLTVTFGGTIQPDRLHYAAKVSLTEWQNRHCDIVANLKCRKEFAPPKSLFWVVERYFPYVLNVAACGATSHLLSSLISCGLSVPASSFSFNKSIT